MPRAKPGRTPLHQLPKTVLRQLLEQFETNPNLLTQPELTLAKRICNCGICDWIWLSHYRGRPKRCENCKRHDWDMPLVRKLIIAARSQGVPATVDVSTSAPNASQAP